MYKNVFIGTLFSVFEKEKFCMHAFVQDISPTVLICAKYSSNYVYRKLAFKHDKLNTCKSEKLACAPMILPLNMILPLVIKHMLLSLFSSCVVIIVENTALRSPVRFLLGFLYQSMFSYFDRRKIFDNYQGIFLCSILCSRILCFKAD